MSQQHTITLYRDGLRTPWGFRMVGGRDLNCPLTIQRVTLGTPSEGELRRGDVILRIGNREATKLTHQEAQNLIKNAGNNIQFVVSRSQYTPQSPDIYGPRPLAALAANATPHGLPRTNFSYGAPHRYTPPAPPNAPASQDDDNYEIERERIAVTSQPHRTPVLIQPSVKVKHDTPVGSYLRHVNDPFVRAAPQPSVKHHPVLQHANETLMRARLHDSVTSAASNSSGIGSPRGRSETPDSGSVPIIVHRQYNSPIDMYSAQNVAASIAGQTGVHVTPESIGNLIKAAIGDYVKGVSGPNPMRILDITKSPTYQTIREDEWMRMSKMETREYEPVQNKVKTVTARPQSNEVNPFGSSRNKVAQSKIFNVIADTLASDL